MDSYVFEVSNLHCSSCETSVKEALAPVIPPSWQVFVSVAEGKVTLVPDEGKLDSKGIRRVVDRLLASGYDVEDMNVDEIVAKPGWFRQFKSALFDGGQKEKRHKKHCESCRDEKHKESEDSDEAPTIIGENSPATATEFKTTFAIGGMSCVSCSNQITETVKAQFPSLDTFAVDLMNKSAVVIINNKTTATKIQECIRGMGYMCDHIQGSSNEVLCNNKHMCVLDPNKPLDLISKLENYPLGDNLLGIKLPTSPVGWENFTLLEYPLLYGDVALLPKHFFNSLHTTDFKKGYVHHAFTGTWKWTQDP